MWHTGRPEEKTYIKKKEKFEWFGAFSLGISKIKDKRKEERKHNKTSKASTEQGQKATGVCKAILP